MYLATMFPSATHTGLIDALQEAHYEAALQNHNASSQVARITYASSGDLGKAVAAAMLAQGGLHAPIIRARDLLEHEDGPWAGAYEIIKSGKRVPGFGNSFYKDRIDPAFKPVYDALPINMIDLICAAGAARSKLFPNAAIITAAVCIAARLPRGVEPLIFAYCRIPAWTKLCLAMKLPQI